MKPLNYIFFSVCSLLSLANLQAQTPSATIQYDSISCYVGSLLDYNNWSQDVGITFHVNFTVNNMRGKTGRILVFFYDENGNPLKDGNNKYCTTDGGICTFETFTPGYDGTRYTDFKLEIPYKEMHMLRAKRREITYLIVIRDNNNTTLTRRQGTMIYTQSTFICSACAGGKCGSCFGKGYTGWGEYMSVCFLCGGTGKCSVCGGAKSRAYGEAHKKGRFDTPEDYRMEDEWHEQWLRENPEFRNIPGLIE